ncbi:MAG: phosphonate ABC transporter, permease protein PhnE [Pseudomonadota bacterium]
MNAAHETLRADAYQIAPDIVRPSLADRARRVAPAVIVACVVVFCFLDLNLDLSRLSNWSEIAGRMVAGLLSPTPGNNLDRIVDALIETMAMAVAGTVLAVSLALPLGIAGSRTVIANPIAHNAIRFVYDLLRAIPALIWAIIIIRAVGLGPVAGVFAIGLAEAPYIAKLFAEYLDNIDAKPRNALIASGASRFQAFRFAILPQILPQYVGLSLYFFELNVRAAAALGVVGAGGLGVMLEDRLGYAAFDEVAFMIILLLVIVAVVDTISSRLRQRIMGNDQISWG